MPDPYFEAFIRSPPCPECGERGVLTVLYGEVDSESEFARVRGLLEFGGCQVGPDDPAYYCRSCGLRFGKQEDSDG